MSIGPTKTLLNLRALLTPYTPLFALLKARSVFFMREMVAPLKETVS
jgi:hypothetical protein